MIDDDIDQGIRDLAAAKGHEEISDTEVQTIRTEISNDHLDNMLDNPPQESE